MARSLSEDHKHNISEALKLHHKRKRRSKTLIGRVVNHFTSKTRREQRKVPDFKAGQLRKIAQNIKDNRDEIVHLRQELTQIPNNAKFKQQRDGLRNQIVALRQANEHLKVYRERIRGNK